MSTVGLRERVQRNEAERAVSMTRTTRDAVDPESCSRPRLASHLHFPLIRSLLIFIVAVLINSECPCLMEGGIGTCSRLGSSTALPVVVMYIASCSGLSLCWTFNPVVVIE